MTNEELLRLVVSEYVTALRSGLDGSAAFNRAIESAREKIECPHCSGTGVIKGGYLQGLDCSCIQGVENEKRRTERGQLFKVITQTPPPGE